MSNDELTKQVTLVDVRCLEFKADRRADQGSPLPPVFTGSGDTQVRFEINPVAWGAQIETWCRVSLTTPDAKLSAAYAITYSREQNDEISEDARVAFLEQEAIPTLMPFLREAIQDLSARLRVPVPLLPVIREGDFYLTEASRVASASESAVPHPT